MEGIPVASQPVSPVKKAKRSLLDQFENGTMESVELKRGRPAYYERFPGMVRMATDFLEERGLAAHGRRRETTSQAIGCSANELRLHLVDQIEDLPLKFSNSTVRRLMQPPNKGRKAAQRYKGLIDARVGKKENTVAKEHVNSHYLKCRVKYALELSALNHDEIEVFSADAKDKLRLGGPVVSRHIKVRSYSLIRDDQSIPDHDFPSGSGYKYIPDGYMNLKGKSHSGRRRCRSLENISVQPYTTATSSQDDCIGTLHSSNTRRDASECELTIDNLGRTHLKYPRTGPLWIKLRPQKFFTATNFNHLNDLRGYIDMSTTSSNKKSVVVLCDNGPDWSKSSLKTMLCMGRLWRDLELDCLLILSFAPGDSKYNMIEHAWAPVTRWLSQLVTRDTLPEDTPPLQHKLPNEVLKQKEVKLFNLGASHIKGCLNDRTYDGHAVTCEYVSADNNDSQYYQDEDIINIFAKACRRDIKTKPGLADMQREVRMLSMHCAQGMYSLEYIRCTDAACSHCSALGPERSPKTLKLLRECQGHVFVPVWSTTHEGHYSTFLEQMHSTGANIIPLDTGLPSHPEIERCMETGCHKTFHSNADRKRHMFLVHDN